METDAKWGCGEDGKGENKMGKILMKVRDQLPAPMTVKPTDVTATRTASSNARKIVLILGNSNTRGLSAALLKQDVNASAFVFPGRTSAQIKERIPHCKTQTPPTHVVIHTGDIDVRQRMGPRQTLDTIRMARKTFPANTKILVNALPTGVHNHALRNHLQMMNIEMKELCESLPNTSFIRESSNLQLRDRIHLTRNSITKLATSIKNHV